MSEPAAQPFDAVGFDALVTLFERVTSPTRPVADMTTGAVLDAVRKGRWSIDAQNIRCIEDTRDRQAAKRDRLPVLTLSGAFDERRSAGLRAHSGFLALDFDHVADLAGLRAELEASPHVAAVFLSVSGDGLKALVPVRVVDPETGEVRRPRDDAEHKRTFAAARALFPSAEADQACKDVSRCCFVSSDPDLYTNEGAVAVETDAQPAPRPQRAQRARQTPQQGQGTTEAERVRSALLAVPSRPDYHEWIRVIAAVLDAVGGSEAEAEALLREWSPEEVEGEYRAKMRAGLSTVTAGTLFYLARQHGWRPGPEPRAKSPESPKSPVVSDATPAGSPSPADDSRTPFTPADLVREIGDRTGRAAEDTASRLSALAATAAPADLVEMGRELERRGARVRWVREWTGDVRAQAKANARIQAEAAREAKTAGAPRGLKGGALNAWLADQLRDEVGGFARDPGGALYRYDAQTGRYAGPCEGWVAGRVRAILAAADYLESFGKLRADAVAYDLATTADALWTLPPENRLCVLNGVLDLDTGELEPHRPGLWLSTLGLPVVYDPAAGADAPEWQAFFASVFPGDTPPGWGFEFVRWLLTPASGKRPAVLLYGPGDDGKSTFLGLLSDVLGGAEGGAVSAVPLQTLAADRFAQADLFGSVLNVCADLPDEPLAGADVFKRITGGDFVRAERKYGSAFSFSPHAHLLFSSNHPLRLKSSGKDPAFWSRWLVVPFGADFGEGSPSRRSVEDLRAELLAPAALSALLNAALSCADEGGAPAPSGAMVAALEAMRKSVPPVVPPQTGHGDSADVTPSEVALEAVAGSSPTTTQTKPNGTPPYTCPNGDDIKGLANGFGATQCSDSDSHAHV